MTVAASIAAFYASAKGLQDGDAVPVIAVTGTAANVAGIVGGIIVFGDPLSGNPVVLVVECVAFVFVIGAAWLMPAPVARSRVAATGRQPGGRRLACWTRAVRQRAAIKFHISLPSPS